MNATVRRIETSDAAAYWAALKAVVAERRYLLTVQAPTLDSTCAFVSDNVDGNHAQYVALVDGAIVGWADILPNRKEIMSHVGVLGMGVLKQWRRGGIGRQLLTRTMEHAFETGLTRVELEVFAYNHGAIGLYSELGFVHEGIKRNARFINGRYEDVCIMAVCRL